MPGEQGFRSDNGSHLGQHSSSQTLRLGGQPTASFVCQQQPPIAELFPKNAILFAQIIDGLQMTLVHPAGQRGQQEADWVQKLRHRVDPLSAVRRRDLP
jgi:hypothetical protein